LPWFPAILCGILCLLPTAPRGILLHDEGHFLLVANTLADGVGLVAGGAGLGEVREALHASGGALYFTAKPGHILLLALAGALAGGLTTSVALALNAVAAVLAVALAQDIATRRFGRRAGLISGFLLASSPLLCAYGRTALGLPTAVCFALAAFWLAERSGGRRGWWILAGIAAFAAIACHYNAAPLLVALAVGGWPDRPRRCWGWVFGSFAASLACFQLATLLGDFALRDAYPQFRSYFGELRHAFSTAQLPSLDGSAGVLPGSEDGVRGYGSEAWRYLAVVLARGFHVQLLLAVAYLVAVRGERRSWRLLAWWAVFPLAIWSLYHWKVERAFVVAAPGIAVAAGVFLDRLARSPAARARALAAACGLAAMGAGAVLSVPREDRAPFSRAVAANRDAIEALPPGAFTAASFNWRSAPLWKWNLGPERIRRGGRADVVDFASFDPPLLVAIDPQSRTPDPVYAANLPEFANADPWGQSVEGPDGAYGFASHP